MIVKLLTEHHLEFLSLKGGYIGSTESTLIKMPHCWKSHATALVSYRCCLRYEGNSLILDSCGEDFDELKSKFEGGYSELQAHGQGSNLRFLSTC